MKRRTEKDFWIEMSIREIWTQAHFAELAFKNINPKAINATDAVFSSIHSFLSHCAMISKMLKAKYDPADSQSIGEILKIPIISVVHNRKFRNNLEHYDGELKKWIQNKGINVNIGTYNIGPKTAFSGSIVFISHYDPDNYTYTFVDEDFDLMSLFQEVIKIKQIADNWVKTLRSLEPF